MDTTERGLLLGVMAIIILLLSLVLWGKVANFEPPSLWVVFVLQLLGAVYWIFAGVSKPFPWPMLVWLAVIFTVPMGIWAVIKILVFSIRGIRWLFTNFSTPI